MIKLDSNVGINEKRYNFIVEERLRLENNSYPTYQNNNGMGADFIVKCVGDSSAVRDLSRQTLLMINYAYDREDWFSLEAWKNYLPEQFVSNCAEEKTSLEITKYKQWWFNLSYRKKIKEAKKQEKWSLSNWLYWLEPQERIWFWWGTEILDDNHFLFSTKVLDDPFLSGSLKWLFLGAGAIEVIELDDFKAR